MARGIDRLIICSPYEVPSEYYRYDPGGDKYFRTQGRRPSGYQSMSEDGKYVTISLFEVTFYMYVDRFYARPLLGSHTYCTSY